MADSLLDSVVTDYHIAEIAENLTQWELLAPYLDLTEGEQEVIRQNHHGRYELQKQQALKKWKRKSGDNATYRNLSTICRIQRRVDLAEKIESLPGTKPQLRLAPILDTFQQYLTNSYLTSQHPAIPQWPDSNLSKTPLTFYDLNLQEVPLIELQPSTDPSSLQEKVKSVSLKSTLAKGEESRRMLLYFKGTGGSGKTTISWHACREWAKKRLLKQFQLLIHVDLSHLKIATAFADVIPYPDSSLRPAIAEAIIDSKGSGVCLLLDGLDEAPTELLDFLLVDLLQGRLGTAQLPELSFVMTSRPDWRVTKRLKSVLESCTVLAGFNRESLLHFLDNSLCTASEKKEKLLKEFTINPAFEGLCCHPVNAAIISFVIHLQDTIPKTQTELYELLVKHFLIRHAESRLKIEEPLEIERLCDEFLPPKICSSFRRLCKLAYTAMLELKHLFSNKDLKQAKIEDNLGLLFICPTNTKHGSKQYHSFYHVSVQEFLAAIHLAVMEEGEQVSAVEQFLGNDLVKSPVLPFYAGLTSFSNTKAFKAVSKPLPQVGTFKHVVKQVIQSDKAPMQQVVAFIRCLYECQNESVMQLPEANLPEDQALKRSVVQRLRNSHKGDTATTEYYNELEKRMKTKSLSLAGIVLTPLDCLSLGFYTNFCAKHLNISPGEHSLDLHLLHCSIKEIGMRLLLTEMAKDVTECSHVMVSLNLAGNQFDGESLLSINELLQGPINIVYLGLANCFDPAVVDLRYALKCIIEGLVKNRVCCAIDLSSNPFNASHIHHIILVLLTCSGLGTLTLTLNNIGTKVISLFGQALALSNVFDLRLHACDLSDSHLLDVLGKKLQTNSRLQSLHLYHSKFTPAGFCKFLRHFKTSSRSCLHKLTVGSNIAKDPYVQTIKREINDFRSTLPHSHVDLVITTHILPEPLRKAIDNISH